MFDEDGNPLEERYDGSRYLRWDHEMGMMVVDTTLPEQDSDDPATLQAFLEYALTDCVAKGTEEYFLVRIIHA